MSTTFGDFSLFLTLCHPLLPGRIVFQYMRNKNIRIDRVEGAQCAKDIWSINPTKVGEVVGIYLGDAKGAKETLAKLEAEGWLEAKNDALGTDPRASGVTAAQMDALTSLPEITKIPLLRDLPPDGS